MPSAAALVVLLAAVAASAFVQRLTGFGFALLAVPLMSFVLRPAAAVVVASFVALPNTAATAAQLRAHVDRPLAVRLFGWSLAGMPFGLAVLTAVPVRPFRVLLGAVIGAATALIASGWRPARPSRRADAVLAVVSGGLSTSTGTNGPPLVVALRTRPLTPDGFRATISAVFVVSNVVSLVLFAARGLVTASVLGISALAVATVPAAAWAGHRVARRLHDHHFDRLVIALLFATAVSSMAAGLRG